MPVVTVQLWPGKTNEQKNAMARRITDAIVEKGNGSSLELLLAAGVDLHHAALATAPPLARQVENPSAHATRQMVF